MGRLRVWTAHLAAYCNATAGDIWQCSLIINAPSKIAVRPASVCTTVTKVFNDRKLSLDACDMPAHSRVVDVHRSDTTKTIGVTCRL